MTLLTTKNGETPSFNNYFDDFFTRDFFNFPTRKVIATSPAVNIKEDEHRYLIELAAPGMEKADFMVNIDENTLTIASNKEQRNEEVNERFTRREFYYNSFKRSFVLPEDLINLEKVKANYENGILKVELPKQAEAKVSKVKEIKVG